MAERKMVLVIQPDSMNIEAHPQAFMNPGIVCIDAWDGDQLIEIRVRGKNSVLLNDLSSAKRISLTFEM